MDTGESSQENLISQGEAETNEEVSSEERVTPVKIRTLADIYARCHMSFTESETYTEATKNVAWQDAMKAELEMIEKNDTWELVDRLSNKPVIGVKWVYKTKLNLDGTVNKYKARLVAKGYAQKPGIDYNETFAPVARLDTIRTLIALASKKNWKLFQLDTGKSSQENLISQGEAETNEEVSSEERVTPVKIRTLADIYARCHMSLTEPETYTEAAGNVAWQDAMKAELEMIEKNDTWELVDRPSNKPVIGVKWVYKTKLNLDGTVNKYKARLVAK